MKDNNLDQIPANSKILDLESKRIKNNIEIKIDGEFFSSKFYTTDMWDTKEFHNLVKNVESELRTSELYSSYIGYLKGELGLTKCAVLGEINDQMAVIEMHHYPFTLYDIVNIVTAKKIIINEKVTSFLVADEVMKLHYRNKIGLVPLSKTVHELVHSGEIFINLNQVFGNVNSFVDEYIEGMTVDHIKSYNELIELSKQGYQNDINEILEKKKTSWNLQKNKPLNNEDI